MKLTRKTAIVVCTLFLAAGTALLYAPAGAREDATSSAPPPQTPPVGGHEAFDTRTPLPLTAMMAEHQKQNMRDHLAAVQEIVAALAVDDMLAVEKAAARIGYSDTMAQMCQHMGAGAPGFSEMALTFHRTADTIADAARGGDRKAVATALAATLSTCVGCHAAYRQQVVDEATWHRLADQSAR